MAEDSNISTSEIQNSEENNPEYLSLNLLFKFIKPFNGSRSELTTFIQNGNSAFQLARPNQKDHLFLYIVSQLSSEVVNEIELEDVASWTELKTKLKSYYGKIKDLTQLHEELETIRQGPNETVTDFFKRLEKLKNTCITAEDNQCEDPNEFQGLKKSILRTALRRFILHTKPDISQMLRARDIKTLNEAFNIASQEEKILTYTRNPKKSESLYCSNCKMSNHSTQNCRRKPKARQEFPPRTSQQFQPKHIGQFNSTKFCNYCKNKGHDINECRKRQFKEQNRSSYFQNPSNPRVNQVTQEIQNEESSIPEDSGIQRSFKINTIARENDPKFITFTSSNSEQKLRFLIDTGAAVSLIKHDVLVPQKTVLDIKDIITITGIAPNRPISTLGSAEISLNLEELHLNFRIHVINAYKITIDFDGILGEDFFTSQNAEISYTTKTIKIANTIIPFNNDIHSKQSNSITLPGRSEITAQVKVDTNLKEGIINRQEISPNVLIPNALVMVNDKKEAICNILNTNENEVIINVPTIALEEVEQTFRVNLISSKPELIHYALRDIKEPYNSNVMKYSNRRDRSRLLQENLRIDHMNTEEKGSLINLCM